ERVLENIRKDASVSRDELVEMFEKPGSYRDLERGAINFYEFYEFLCDRAGYRGSIRDFHALWSDFFDGPVAGMEELLERVRERSACWPTSSSTRRRLRGSWKAKGCYNSPFPERLEVRDETSPRPRRPRGNRRVGECAGAVRATASHPPCRVFEQGQRTGLRP